MGCMGVALIEEFKTMDEAITYLAGILFALKQYNLENEKDRYQIYKENNKWGIWID